MQTLELFKCRISYIYIKYIVIHIDFTRFHTLTETPKYIVAIKNKNYIMCSIFTKKNALNKKLKM